MKDRLLAFLSRGYDGGESTGMTEERFMNDATCSNAYAMVRAATFFAGYFVVGGSFGGWLTYHFGWGAGSEHGLHLIGFSLGLITLALSLFPLWFAWALVRSLRTHQE
ncbi:hypothetical protein Pan216_19300 [Planctomycetes bacterium Pan216]|uniref:Uncharacterized protein n=1 Tax=Kolteria novifilia TaxID=2527975 RepID=A0A518B263_9BACT|nr:hypothetical protein Pan216_19300 [Planctomycetes bacterium Pan216]